MSIIFRPLERVRKIIESTGLEVTYAYEDLVFANHSVFLIRFDDENQDHAFLYFNVECDADEAAIFEKQMLATAKADKFSITNAGKFSVEQESDSENITIKFQ